jgi:hypothetical protein
MSKAQRLRLTELKGKANLTADESAELHTLTALASQHPDSTQDTDEAPAAAAAAPSDFRAILAGIGASFRSKGAVAADLSAARESITALTAERDTARGQVTALTAERDTACTDAASARAEATATAATLATLCKFLGLDAAGFKGKDSKAVQKILEDHVSAAATEKLGEMGFPAAKLPPANSGDQALESLADIQALMAKTTDPVELGKLAARANKLRDAEWGQN